MSHPQVSLEAATHLKPGVNLRTQQHILALSRHTDGGQALDLFWVCFGILLALIGFELALIGFELALIGFELALIGFELALFS
jgi:hypothetical protein